jgi:hypothetical protein
MFLRVAELVKRPEDGVLRFVRFERLKQRYDFRRQIGADPPAVNIVVKSGPKAIWGNVPSDLENMCTRYLKNRLPNPTLTEPTSGAPLPQNDENAMIDVWAAVALGRRHLICSRQHRQESLCRHR